MAGHLFHKERIEVRFFYTRLKQCNMLKGEIENVKSFEGRTFKTKMSDGSIFAINRIQTIKSKYYVYYVAYGEYSNSNITLCPLDLDRINLTEEVSKVTFMDAKLDFRISCLEGKLKSQLRMLGA